MIYQALAADIPLSQGDIIDRCPIWVRDESPEGIHIEPREIEARVVVLTQACDLAQPRAGRVVVAAVHSAQDLVDRGVLKARMVSDQIRLHRVYGWYFLPAGPIGESIVDLRDLHTLPRSLLERLVAQGNRSCRISTPYREHLAQHFATTYARIGLPEPYETEEA